MIPVVISELAFFQMQVKRLFVHPSEPGQPIFGKSPETFNTINMGMAIDEFIAAMIHAQMLGVAQIDQSVIAPPAIRMDDRIQIHLSTYNGL